MTPQESFLDSTLASRVSPVPSDIILRSHLEVRGRTFVGAAFAALALALGGACLGSTAPSPGSCNSNADCTEAGQACIGGTCQDVSVVCTGDADCEDGEVCIAGACMPPDDSCLGDEDCDPPATVCVDGQCESGCTAGTCPIETHCDAETGHCLDGCVTDQHCGPPDRICLDGSCEDGCATTGCSTGESCDTNTGRCLPDGPCSSDADCGPPGSICEGGDCVAGCLSTGCGHAEHCDHQSGRCQPGCLHDSHCSPPGSICEGGDCVAGCLSAGCGHEEYCNQISGRCEPGCLDDSHCDPPDDTCVGGTCACVPDCAGRNCGDDGCGGNCGACPPSQVCGPDGVCLCKDGELDTDSICDFWVLEAGSFQWLGYNLDSSGSAHAPSSTIRAAFDIEEDDLAFVLTADGVHEFRPSQRSWLATRTISSLDPDLSTTTILAAASIPSTHGSDENTEDATIHGFTAGQHYVWQKSYDRSTGLFSDATGGLHGEPFDWDDPNAPLDVSSMLTEWLDLENSRGWIQTNPSEICETQSQTVGPYVGLLTSSHLHVLEAGHCFAWLDPIPVDEFEPMMYTGAPPVAEIGASFWHQGAWFVFRR